MTVMDEMQEPIILAERLEIDYTSQSGTVHALRGVDLFVEPGERIGLVGGSGSGKSTLGLAIGGLLPENARCVGGSLSVAGIGALDASAAAVRTLRRKTLGFIPQNPIGSLDPTMRIGAQLRFATGLRRRDRVPLAGMLDDVRIREPERVLSLYPHEISGGMAQRVAIAMVLARQPRVLIADEPTAALDSLVRSEILELVFGRAAELGTAVVLLSHDLRAVSRWCARVAVMHHGEVVETGSADRVLSHPQHPYTRSLVSADLRLGDLSGSDEITEG